MGNSFSATGSTANAISIFHRILNTTFGKETYTNIALQDAITADVIPMDELIVLGAEWRYSHGKAIGILRSTSAITSAISSSIFIWMILRSHVCLSTTQHRLLLGLCISDIISSLSHSTFNAMAPSDNDYWVWNARGNEATCTAQGFLAALGSHNRLFYNASLNIYFLALVYKNSDEFIRAKMEPFLHGVPIVLALSFSIYKLFQKHYNDDGGGVCIDGINAAPHCYGYDVGEIRDGFEIPCWRGIDRFLTRTISGMVLMFVPVLVMIVSLGMIYSAVRTQEKNLSRNGVCVLRSNLQQQSVSTPQSTSGMWGRISMSLTALLTSLKAAKWSWRNTHEPVTRSTNSKQSQSRVVMRKAFAYTFAWFLSYGFWLSGITIQIATGSFPLVLDYLATIFVPLQGLFNLLIFMHPKIVAAKKRGGGETVSWCQAFSTAFWSRGKGVNNQGTNQSNLRGGTSNRRQKKKTKNEEAVSDNVSSPMFGRIKKKIADIYQEEEKCEIQVPDNLDPRKTKAMYSAASTAAYAPNIVPTTDSTFMHTAVDFEKNVIVGSTLSDILEDPDEDVMLNQDEDDEIDY